uniref:Uncharacterized protein n=1 Tax=Chromera velia CCMP2878 TaxID=1169474 RepID=A0A0G4FTJ6_9ALVE|eukprot:Cvel_18719.t1-p1 / transcript=Cvel_18719.t1 / gene=Cvel_18719 / organism=Chromera_velia_CCMP2878 / gene_product=hypothetical protein / transcript_product=hypothetical protein / location=Cvel_scaffold1569:16116-20846(+) / protein_length=159 / sequence_SO=supercontig / SO=protein_coding / is_pseudo=false
MAVWLWGVLRKECLTEGGGDLLFGTMPYTSDRILGYRTIRNHDILLFSPGKSRKEKADDMAKTADPIAGFPYATAKRIALLSLESSGCTRKSSWWTSTLLDACQKLKKRLRELGVYEPVVSPTGALNHQITLTGGIREGDMARLNSFQMDNVTFSFTPK